MQKRTNLLLPVVLFLLSSNTSTALARGTGLKTLRLLTARISHSLTADDREQDGLVGPVRRVKTETAKISPKNGKPVEGPRAVLETATYDIKGGKVDNAYFLSAGGSLTGKEVYKYDDKGNIVEMTLHDSDGTLLTKEVYSYEFDAMGNWTKMITSVAVIEGGKMNFEPTEVTYRTISYFLDEAMMAKMSQPAAVPANNVAASPSVVQPQATAVPAADVASIAVANNNASAPSVSIAATPLNATAAPSPVKAGALIGAMPPAVEKGGGNNPAAMVAAKSGDAVKSERKLAAAPPPAVSLDKAGIAAPSNLAATASTTTSPMVKTDGEAPVRPVARGPLKPVSGGILNGKAVNLPSPLYPEMAKRSRTMGMVTVEVVIDVTGKVISAKASSGPSLLQAAAEKAALQARFSPTLLSGQPVKVSGQINYNFTLQ